MRGIFCVEQGVQSQTGAECGTEKQGQGRGWHLTIDENQKQVSFSR